MAEDKFWHAQLIRLTLFPRTPISIDNLGWWKEVTGLVPEAVNSQPRLNSVIESGVVESKCNLVLQVQPSRIDWLLQPVI